jgi:hypothetical protein
VRTLDPKAAVNGEKRGVPGLHGGYAAWKLLEHFRNSRSPFESIERWLFLEEKAT